MNDQIIDNELKTPGFKGFNKDFKCKDKQYIIGEIAVNDNYKLLEICKNGLHFCENPLDIFKYYNPSTARFAEVEGIGEAVKHNEDSKIATSKLLIKTEISLHNLVNFAVKFILS